MPLVTTQLPAELPPDSEPAVRIVQTLRAAGHTALLAGGCVRDLLRGEPPSDYDVATDATPRRVCELLRPTRQVGAHFGVVLVRSGRRWVEVATFRTDGQYRDGRRPEEVTFGSAEQDALRRDFTINGMFLDPLERRVLDYVGGLEDLAGCRIRAIGEPSRRFAEDHLRLIRAVRFAARLSFEIEPATFDAIRTHAVRLSLVATERVREELERMLAHPSRRAAVELMHRAALLPHLVPGLSWTDSQVAAVLVRLERLPADATFEAAMACLLAEFSSEATNEACRRLTCSNEQRETIRWLVANQAALDQPGRIELAALKRLMAHPAFGDLRSIAAGRFEDLADGRTRSAALQRRLDAIDPASVQPAPLVTGDDLHALGLAPGPVYKELLDELYTAQLNEQLQSREDAMNALHRALRQRGLKPEAIE